MNQRLYKLIDEYLEEESRKLASDIMFGRRIILEDFVYYLDECKGRFDCAHQPKDWDIRDVTEADTEGYYKYLERNSNRYGRTLLAMKIVFQFLSFAGGKIGKDDHRDSGTKED